MPVTSTGWGHPERSHRLTTLVEQMGLSRFATDEAVAVISMSEEWTQEFSMRLPYENAL